jgi:outer membrane protein OmpA-like peptidoglycan-associated protein
MHQQGASPDTSGYSDKKDDDLERPSNEPPTSLKQSFLFLPGTVLLTRVSKSNLRRAALWLREHRQTRVLVAGFCDPTGSEKCNHTLAERRGTAVGKLLVGYGVEPGQMVAIKGWEKAEPLCETNPACQQLNRKARIFLAGGPPVPTK